MSNKIQYGGVVLEKMGVLEYEFGGMTPVPQILLFENGNALAWLPENESQIGVYFCTWACVSFSALNCIETVIHRMLANFTPDNRRWLLKNVYKNDRPNFSDRDLAVLSGTKKGTGNTAAKVLQTIQKEGIIPEHIAPWDFRNRDPNVNNAQNYYNYQRSLEGERLAAEWKERFEVVGEKVARHNWGEASKYGALQVFVNAWYQDDDGEYFNPTGGINHAVQMADFSTRQIFDTFEHNGSFLKTLSSWNDAFVWAYKYNIIEKNMSTQKPILLQNCLVQLVEAPGGIGLHLDGRIIIAEEQKLNSTFTMRNSKDGYFSGGFTKTLTKEQWDLFEKVDIDGNKI